MAVTRSTRAPGEVSRVYRLIGHLYLRSRSMVGIKSRLNKRVSLSQSIRRPLSTNYLQMNTKIYHTDNKILGDLMEVIY